LFTDVILFLLSGCNNTDSFVELIKGPFNTHLYKAEVSRTDIICVYQKDGNITKTILTEKNILLKNDNENIEELTKYAEATNQIFTSEQFPTDGYKFTFKLTDESFTWEMTYDYTKMDIKKEVTN